MTHRILSLIAVTVIAGAATLSVVAAQMPQTSRPVTAGITTPDPAAAPNLSGIYMIRFRGGQGNAAPMTPWAQAIMKTRSPEEDPGARCLLPGVPRDLGAPYPLEIVQTPKVVYLLHEYQHMVRRIFINQKHPADLDETFLGHSIGRWDGDTLVVDTIGFNDRTWMGPSGQPHSEQLHVVERFKKLADGKTLEIETTIDDPKAYTATWTMKNTYVLRPDLQIMEYICQENNRAITK